MATIKNITLVLLLLLAGCERESVAYGACSVLERADGYCYIAE